MSPVTPVELRDGRWYKRDDLNRGPGGVNGGKWRQCQHLIREARLNGAAGIVSGASVLSPQLPMVATACELEGLPCELVIGGTTPEQAVKHPGVALAAERGAQLHAIKVGYNPALQAEVKRRAEARGWAILPYGIAPASTDRLGPFYALGAAQSSSLPDPIKTLIVPFGSGNSAISILYGLELRRPAELENVLLVGIGPSKWDYLLDRCSALGFTPGLGYSLVHEDLHAAGAVAYGRRVPYTSDGIVLHPTYEGKIAAWLDAHRPVDSWSDRDGTACLWIVGGPL